MQREARGETKVVAPELRITPIDAARMSEAERTALGPLADREPLDNVFATLARHPRLLQRYVGFGLYILNRSTLDPRLRELAILDVAERTGCEYEFAQHARLGTAAGLTGEEVDRILDGTGHHGWSDEDVAVLTCVHELIDSHVVSSPTWVSLSSFCNDQQLMDLVFTVGTYTLLAWALNSFGVQLDDFLVEHPWPPRPNCAPNPTLTGPPGAPHEERTS